MRFSRWGLFYSNVLWSHAALLAVSSLPFLGVATSLSTETHLKLLSDRGVPAAAIIGYDERGVPKICGVGLQMDSPPADAVLASSLPSGMRSWECIPNVIRNDGVETFRVEVDVNGPVNQVSLRVQTDYVMAQSGQKTVVLHDDGVNGDRILGDYIFTSEPIRYRVSTAMPPYYGYTTNAIPGIDMQLAGFIDILETNGFTTEFLKPPCIGFLNTNIALVQTVMLSSNIQGSTHFLNVVTSNREVQRSLRSATGGSFLAASSRVYSVLPDAFDFLSYLSTDHVEWTPSLTGANYIGGIHGSVRRLFNGSGAVYSNPSVILGSTNKLQGVNAYDVLNFGYGDSLSAFHEYMHLWAAYTGTNLGLTTGSHFRQNCSAFSPVGGFKAVFITNGSTIRVRRACDGNTEAPPIDKYMMGLISTSAVPPLYVMTNFPNINCDNLDYFTNAKPVTIADIVAVHGVRSPGPESAQRHFSIGFVAASYERLLNNTEMTFYDYIAEYFTRPLPPETPAPGLWDGYVPITKFVGEGVTWSSLGLGLIRPTITNVQWLVNGFRVDGTGYPGRSYRLLWSSNLVSWTQVTNKIAGTNGSFSLYDSSLPRPKSRWYRVVTP